MKLERQTDAMNERGEGDTREAGLVNGKGLHGESVTQMQGIKIKLRDSTKDGTN